MPSEQLGYKVGAHQPVRRRAGPPATQSRPAHELAATNGGDCAVRPGRANEARLRVVVSPIARWRARSRIKDTAGDLSLTQTRILRWEAIAHDKEGARSNT